MIGGKKKNIIKQDLILREQLIWTANKKVSAITEIVFTNITQENIYTTNTIWITIVKA